MRAAAHPLAELHELAARRATGELVSSSARAETHVYLHRGRVAWAIDSRRPGRFAAHLESAAGVAPELLRELAEECRRGRLPFGETVVAWGIATPAQLRHALHKQIEETIGLLDDETARVLFLARDWSGYDGDLTFTVDELVRGSSPSAAADVVARVRASVDGLAWVELVESGRAIAGEPASHELRTPLELIDATLSDGAEMVAVQSRSRCIVGVHSSATCSLWCRLSDSGALGGALARLSAMFGPLDRRSEPRGPRTSAAAWQHEDHGSALSVLREFSGRAHEILAALVADREGRVVAGIGFGDLELASCNDLIARRGRALVPDRDGPDASTSSMMTAEPSTWCFGSTLGPDRSLWLLLDRSNSQGLGWHYLTTLARTLAASTPT